MTITHICHTPDHNPLASDWLHGSNPALWLAGPDPAHTGDNSDRDGGRQTWWLTPDDTLRLWSWSGRELMIIAIIIFLRAEVVQSINQMLISRCAWFIGHATNWAFYQETKCGNTKILYILFIRRIKGYLWFYGLSWKSKMIAMLLNYSLQLGSENVITRGLSG